MSSDIFFFFNGQIVTVDKNFSIQDSFAVLDEKIIAVGMKSDVEVTLTNKFSDNTIKKVDLIGKTVVPGFIDSHTHPIIAIYFKTQLPLTNVTSFKDLKKIFENSLHSKLENEWTLGLDFLEERFLSPQERRFPTRKDLDIISRTHPIIILRHDGHSCVTNTRGLDLLGIRKETLSNFSMQSGRIEVDEYGEPNGIFTETATSLLLDQIPTPNFENFTQVGLAFSKEMASYGITTIGAILQTTEEGPSGKTGSIEFPIIQILIRENVLLQDYVMYLITDKPKKLARFSSTIEKLDQGKHQFVVGGIKRFLDGVIGARTAYMNKPFSDGPPNNRGFLVHDKKELLEQFQLAYDMGYHLLCHSIGDNATQIIVEIYREIKKKEHLNIHPEVMRIEHAAILTPQLLEDIQKNNIIISTQPAFIESEYLWLESRLGKERCQLTYPFKSIMRTGIILAGASDAPVESPNVLNAIGTAIHRNGFIPEESITIEQALQMFTINAAIALGQDKIKGSIELGKFADFVILDKNILKTETSHIKKIRILQTFRRGKPIFIKDSD